MLNSPENRNRIITGFPNLKTDSHFKIVGKPNPNFNCIAWAGNRSDVWWEALPFDKRPSYTLEGVKLDWPFDIKSEFSISALIDLFSHLKYVDCIDSLYEEGFRKVAFYELNGVATHAARQLTASPETGIWTSKLGGSYTITHGTPFTIESSIYGKACHFMKTKMS
ncbi:hypothetical protein [Zobellia sp. 1_MG-2023]|uniref:DUF7689 domain-containing protein n=1 Tax=Zobellia sp. 1_MG-2023 TaxID=3062626 RepID=UPI0026E373FA|nr:hypothetical protein [Zobellia sp. 1_MG-2023]MDO6818089.1 hypothetical protein [Zobellia sp. 1_MG-2023]